VFYRFLNFWKIIELTVKDKGPRWAWINAKAPQLGLHRERIQEIVKSNPDVAEYLDYSGGVPLLTYSAILLSILMTITTT
jgi:hypothetical protein